MMLFSSAIFKMPTKNFAYYFYITCTFTSFFTDKKSQNRRYQSFCQFFLLDDGRAREAKSLTDPTESESATLVYTNTSHIMYILYRDLTKVISIFFQSTQDISGFEPTTTCTLQQRTNATDYATAIWNLNNILYEYIRIQKYVHYLITVNAFLFLYIKYSSLCTNLQINLLNHRRVLHNVVYQLFWPNTGQKRVLIYAENGPEIYLGRVQFEFNRKQKNAYWVS